MRKAGKQFDKFSQSIGERFMKEGKTEHSSAFRDLEQDVDVRAKGMERLALASSTYIRATGKKNKSEDPETSDGGKVLPVEQLGLVMISYGEKLGRDSEYGKALVQIGRAKCKIAAIQDSYVEEIGEGYLAGLERAMEQVEDFRTYRKKLDSRRLTMDAANKRAASSKKDSRALEEEVRVAQARYDECQEDVEARMTTIYESEATYQDDLNGFLDAEVAYIDRYREALMEAKNAVGGSLAPSRPSLPQRRSLIPPPANDRRRSSPSSDPEPLAPPPSSSSFLGSRARSNSTKSGDGKDPTAAAAQKEKKSLFGSLGRKKSGLTPKRGATSSWGALDEDGDGARDGMVNGRGGSSEEDEDERPRSSGGNRNRSFSSATVVQSGSGGEFGGGGGRAAPGFPRRNTLGATSSSQGKKVVKSTFAYLATAPDELSFSPGELITVLSEVSPDWWTGTSSTTGSSGLFPAAYTEPAPQQQQHSNTPPPLPSAMRPTAGAQRSHSSNDLLGGAGGGGARRVLPPPPAGPVRQNSFLTDSESNATSASEAESEDDEGEKAGLTGLAPPSSSGGGRARGMSGSLGLGGLVGNGGAKKGLAPPPPVPRSRRSTVSSRGDEGARGGGVSEGENPFH